MSTAVETIKDKLDIVEVVGSYVQLQKAGVNYKAKCPFHNERTPSFTVSPARGSYYCFGCHAKGDIFSFVQQFEGLDFKGALKVLAARAGVTLEREDPARRGETERMFSALEFAKQYYVETLTRDAVVSDYVRRRGLAETTVKEWGIGYAPDEWRALYSYLRGKKFTDEEIWKTGLLKAREGAGERYYDAFRGRVMFPIFDTSGRVVGFSGRTLSKDPTVPKYINSPETQLFNKSEVLYGLHKAKAAIRTKDYSILVEGQLDLLMCHQAGYANTVASSGTALTSRHLERLQKLSNRVVFCYDSDDAGVAAAGKSAKLALAAGMEVKIAALPPGDDPADVILRSPADFAKALKSSKHVVDFQLDRMTADPREKDKIAAELRTKVLPFIARMKSEIEKGKYVAAASFKTGVREQAIWDDLKAVPEEGEQGARAEVRDSRLPTVLPVDRRIAGILYWKPEFEDFRRKAVAICGEERFASIERETADIQDDLIFKTEEYYAGKDILERDMEDLLLSFERRILQEEVERMQTSLRMGGEVDDGLLKRIAEKSRRLDAIQKELGR